MKKKIIKTSTENLRGDVWVSDLRYVNGDGYEVMNYGYIPHIRK